MHDMADEKVLEQLGTASAGAAWAVFLRRHTPLILAVARQYERDEQALHDCYLFVCEKLSDQGFRRLRTWRKRDKVRFTTWLRAVVANLCVDWHRSVQGRFRPVSTIAGLSALERLVYQHRFELGASIRECHEAVRVMHPQLTELDLAVIIRRLNRLLTPQQHWMLATRRRVAVSMDDDAVRQEADQVLDSQQSPEHQATEGEQLQRLGAALRQLSPRQQLMLKLRFQQGLSLQEVARLTGHADLQKARYQLRLALDRLRELLAD